VGIYYGFLQNKSDFTYREATIDNWSISDNSNYPDHTEHQILLRLAAEKQFFPSVVMRLGLTSFYGWVREDLDFKFSSRFPSNDYAESLRLTGSHWGIKASLGGTVKYDSSVLNLY
jgi:hypothetical protein